jgi:starvation-inducible DNA-binding protein
VVNNVIKRENMLALQPNHLLPTRIDISTPAREELIAVLNQQLADVFDLYSQTKQAHWNVRGPNFYSLHEMFDRIAGELLRFVDDIAERVTALGGIALGTVGLAAKATRLPECDVDVTDGMPVISDLADRFGAVASRTREAIDLAEAQDDAATADLLTEVTRGLDKNLWFLDAHTR